LRGEVFEVHVDIADAVFSVDQIRVHQGMPQNSQAVAPFLSQTCHIQTERIEDALGFGIAQDIGAQGGDRSEELFVLQWAAWVAAQFVVQMANECIGSGNAVIAHRIQGNANEIAVGHKRYHHMHHIGHCFGELQCAGMEGFGMMNGIGGQQAKMGMVDFLSAMPCA